MLWIEIIVALITLISLLIAIYKLGYKHGRRPFELKETTKSRKLQLKHIYAPLRKMLIDCDLTRASLVKFPYISQRWKRALPYLKKFKLGNFFKKLFDKGISTSEGLDYGHFDLNRIERIVKDNIVICDSKMVSLTQRALREERDRAFIPKKQGELYKEDLELMDYIYRQYTKLSKILK